MAETFFFGLLKVVIEFFEVIVGSSTWASVYTNAISLRHGLTHDLNRTI